MIILIDHYDSFSAILTDYFKRLDYEVLVIHTDKISLDEIKILNPSHIVIGPGPGHPNDLDLKDVYSLIEHYQDKAPILGVCLGHQIIASFFGAKIISLPIVHHGVISRLDKCAGTLFQGIPNKSLVTRYHSLMLDKDSLPSVIKIMAECMDNDSGCEIIMAIEHVDYSIYGVQFHPEAILTSCGLKLLKNFFGA